MEWVIKDTLKLNKTSLEMITENEITIVNFWLGMSK